MKIYVHAKSKKAVNEMLAQGKTVTGINYSMFGDGGLYVLTNCEAGTVVAIYDKMIGSNPVAKSWGTWNPEKNRLD
jgi:hypothetical protein